MDETIEAVEQIAVNIDMVKNPNRNSELLVHGMVQMDDIGSIDHIVNDAVLDWLVEKPKKVV